MTWRKLKHNKSTQIARTLMFVDCETRSEDKNVKNLGANKLWFGVVNSGRFVNERGTLQYARRDSYTFHESGDFWSYVRSKSRVRETTWIYAHNAGFDFVILGLIPLLAKGELTITKPRKVRRKDSNASEIYGLLMVEDPPTVIGVEDSEGRRYVLCDTLNYWRVSLEALGKDLGYEKEEMPDWDAAFARWERYCRRDVEVIEQAVVQLIHWWKDRDLGNWRWTAPGLAMSAFRHKFMSHDIVFHDEMDIRQLERESYFGGQLEAFYIGHIREPVWQFDVVSLYPSVMKGNLYPVKLVNWSNDDTLTPFPPPIEPKSSICEVEVALDRATLPVRHNDCVYYAAGTGRVVLSGPELDWAVSHGYVQRWGRWATYEMADIFSDYVDYFILLKDQYEKAQKPVQRFFVKMLLNSLYGKFGQYGGSWQPNPDRLPLHGFGKFWEYSVITGEYQKCLAIGDIVLDWSPKSEVSQAAPAIASFVTSYARQLMRHYREIAGDGNYYYMATDSLMVNEQGFGRLLNETGCIGSKLGQLKHERDASSAWIGGLHWYRCGDKLVEGSKKSSAVTIDETSWTELHFESLLSVIDRSKEDDGRRDAVVISEVEKTRSGQYNKGHVGDDGWVTPFTFAELEQC